MKRHIECIIGIFVSVILLNACERIDLDSQHEVDRIPFVNTGNYELPGDGTIPEEVLKNYMSRAITHFEFADDLSNNSPHKEDDERAVLNMGAKFIGRSLYMWGGESRLNNPEWLEKVKEKIDRIHQDYPEIIFQAAIFEFITDEVNTVPIPDFVYSDFGEKIPNYQTFFNAKRMSGSNTELGNGVDEFVPDISKLEFRMYLYYVACLYMDAGIEAIHFGQAEMIAQRNKDYWPYWEDVLKKIKNAAKTRARRHTLLTDAHMPSGGMKVEDRLLFDFTSFPLILMPVMDEEPYPEFPTKPRELIKPQKAIIKPYYSNGMEFLSKGGITPSGWSCERVPYLVELDNGGISDHPNEARVNDWMLWGYDDVSWFHMQPEWYQNEFIVYATEWHMKYDPIGFFQPLSRRASTLVSGNTYYYANTKSDACPDGMGQEETIKALWSR